MALAKFPKWLADTVKYVRKNQLYLIVPLGALTISNYVKDFKLNNRDSTIEIAQGEVDSLKTSIWAKDVLNKTLSNELGDCHEDWDRLPYAFWYKKLKTNNRGEWEFIMVFVNKTYENEILGPRASARSYPTHPDYFAHPTQIAKEYWKSDSLVVKHWKKIPFKEKVKMAGGRIELARVDKWPERREDDIYVFGIIWRYEQ